MAPDRDGKIFGADRGNHRAHGGSARLLVALCAATLLSVPAVQHVAELRAPARAGAGAVDGGLPQCYDVLRTLPAPRELGRVRGLDDALDLLPTVPELLDYERSLEGASVVSRLLRPWLQVWLSRVLGVGTERAWIGRNGWLFHGQAVTHLTGPGFLEERILIRRVRDVAGRESAPHPDPIPAITDFRDQLAERDIELVVMPVPPKAAIHPERLSRRYEGATGPIYNPSFPEFRRRLEERGVRIFDPSDALWETREEKGAAFLATDSHWTPEGAGAAARALAAYLRENLPLGEVAPVAYTATGLEVENTGDVAVMLGLRAADARQFRERVRIRQQRDPAGRLWAPDPRSEVLVLGDSYGNIYSQEDLGWGSGGGFVEQLSAELGWPLDAIRMNAGGAQATRQALATALARGVDRLAGKRLVIYEFAMSELSWGDWEPVELGPVPPSAAPPSSFSAPDEAPQAPIIVSGRVATTSGVPTPGSTPYPDCIVSIHLDRLRIEEGSLPSSELVAYLWGLRDDRPTAAAGLGPGQRVRLKLLPWEQVEPRLGGHRRIELDDPDLRGLDSYWAESTASIGAPGIAALPRQAASAPISVVEPFLADMGRRAAEAEGRGESVVRGRDSWLFLARELRHLGVGPFWGEAASEASRHAKGANADPMPVILDFHAQLSRAGIELLFVPVPTKAILYPDQAASAPADPALASLPRLDPHHQAFYAELGDRGVEVIDLVPELRAARAAGGEELFCRRDSHWSGVASRIAAHRIAERIDPGSWGEEPRRRDYVIEQRSVEIMGDLARTLADPDLGPEQIQLDFVRRRVGDRLEAVEPTARSPLLVLADSYGLIFHMGGELHAIGAGLPDHLAFELGFPVDLIANVGSGVNAPRVTLARHPERLTGKRCVVWIVDSMTFTENFGGWQQIKVLP